MTHIKRAQFGKFLDHQSNSFSSQCAKHLSLRVHEGGVMRIGLASVVSYVFQKPLMKSIGLAIVCIYLCCGIYCSMNADSTCFL